MYPYKHIVLCFSQKVINLKSEKIVLTDKGPIGYRSDLTPLSTLCWVGV